MAAGGRWRCENNTASACCGTVASLADCSQNTVNASATLWAASCRCFNDARAIRAPRGRLGPRFGVTKAGSSHSTTTASDTTQDAPIMAWMRLCSSTAVSFASTASARTNRSCADLRGWSSYSGFFVLFVLGSWPKMLFKGRSQRHAQLNRQSRGAPFSGLSNLKDERSTLVC
jgi:hypothetical protein